MAKVQIYGKIIARTHHATDRGELYSIVLEEPGVYPSRFQLSSKDASLFGQPDGPLGVGKMATATAFANSREREVPSKKDPAKKVKVYSVWFTLTALETAGDAPAPAEASGEDTVNEDLPF